MWRYKGLRAVLSNLGCILEPPGELREFPTLWSHLRLISSDLLGLRPEHQYFFNPLGNSDVWDRLVGFDLKNESPGLVYCKAPRELVKAGLLGPISDSQIRISRTHFHKFPGDVWLLVQCVNNDNRKAQIRARKCSSAGVDTECLQHIPRWRVLQM